MQSINSKLQNLQEYVGIGFDIDHCLIKYNLPLLFPIVYSAFTKVLIEKHKYPKELASFTDEDRSFIHNALVIDLANHYVIKLGKGKLILRAYFGRKRISDAKLKMLYGTPPIFFCFRSQPDQNSQICRLHNVF